MPTATIAQALYLPRLLIQCIESTLGATASSSTAKTAMPMSEYHGLSFVSFFMPAPSCAR